MQAFLTGLRNFTRPGVQHFILTILLIVTVLAVAFIARELPERLAFTLPIVIVLALIVAFGIMYVIHVLRVLSAPTERLEALVSDLVVGMEDRLNGRLDAVNGQVELSGRNTVEPLQRITELLVAQPRLIAEVITAVNQKVELAHADVKDQRRVLDELASTLTAISSRDTSSATARVVAEVLSEAFAIAAQQRYVEAAAPSQTASQKAFAASSAIPPDAPGQQDTGHAQDEVHEYDLGDRTDVPTQPLDMREVWDRVQSDSTDRREL